MTSGKEGDRWIYKTVAAIGLIAAAVVVAGTLADSNSARSDQLATSSGSAAAERGGSMYGYVTRW